MHFLKMMGISIRILRGAFVLGGLTLNTLAMETDIADFCGSAIQRIEPTIVENPLYEPEKFVDDSNPLRSSTIIHQEIEEVASHQDEADLAKLIRPDVKETMKILLKENIKLKEEKVNLESANTQLHNENNQLKDDAQKDAQKDQRIIIQKNKILFLEKQRMYGVPLMVFLFSYFFYTFL